MFGAAVVQIVMALSVVVGAIILLLPIAAVLVARRDRKQIGRAGNASIVVLIASAVLFGLTPVAASALSPDWSPVTMFLIGWVGWTFTAWSGVFVLRFANGVSGRRAALGAAGVAVFAPLLGAVITISGFFI